MNKQDLINTELKIKELFKQKKIRSFFHLSGGNEDELINIFKKIRSMDWVFSTHRSHYHALLKGMSSEDLIEKVIKNESMHLFNKKLKLFTSSIVGGCLPIAVGVAIGIKRKKLDEHVWVFIGDTCSTMGIFNECVKYSNGFDLPITFVVEDNGYCINAITKNLWGACKDNSKVFQYNYERIYPHSGTGDFVNFKE